MATMFLNQSVWAARLASWGSPHPGTFEAVALAADHRFHQTSLWSFELGNAQSKWSGLGRIQLAISKGLLQDQSLHTSRSFGRTAACILARWDRHPLLYPDLNWYRHCLPMCSTNHLLLGRSSRKIHVINGYAPKRSSWEQSYRCWLGRSRMGLLNTV